MTTCAVCKNTDMRRLIEMGWNSRMTVADIAHAFSGTPSQRVILKHLKEHADPIGERDIPIMEVRTTRQRVEDLQKTMLDEIELRIQHAETLAAAARDAGHPTAVAADFFDVLDKKVQASIASVLKMQDLTDKRDKTKATVAVDVMKLMGGGAPPAHLIEDGVTIEGEAEEVE